MSPNEVTLLQQVGQLFLFRIAVVVTESVLYGLYLAIFAFGIHALMKRQPRTKYTLILCGFLFTLFLLSTANLALEVAFTIGLIRKCLIHSSGDSFTGRLNVADENSARIATAATWLSAGSGSGFFFVIADAVVVWRAYVLWPGNTVARFLLLALLFVSIGSAIVSSTLETISSETASKLPTTSPTGVLLCLNLSLNLATNIVATVLIGYKAYYHRRTMATLGMQNPTTGSILLFLTESGVAFCIIQAIVLATNAANNAAFTGTALDYVSAIWKKISVFAAATYPALVFIIIDNHRSISDDTRGPAGATPASLIPPARLT